MMKLTRFTAEFAAQSVTQTSPRWPILAPMAALLLVFAVTNSALGQALPAAEASPISTGFALPHIAGSFSYAASASESLSWGFYGSQGAYAATNVSGDAAYLSGSKLYPFSMVFSGGHSWATSNQPSYNYLNLALSQVVNMKRWNLLISDSINYLPETPAFGLSGVPGVGDLGIPPVGGSTVQGVFTPYSQQVSNVTSGSLQRQITGKTSLGAFGSYGVTRFLGVGGEGLNSNFATGGVNFSHQVSGRNSFGANYSYSDYSYSGNNTALAEPGFTSQMASGQFTRRFSARLSGSVSAGPEWTTIGAPFNSQTVGLFASASAIYTAKAAQFSAFYSRSINGGFGVIPGGLSQGGGLRASRTFARVWNCAVFGSYTDTSGLPVTASAAPSFSYNFSTTAVGVQASRAIMRSLSTYASYTYEHQPSEGGAVDAFSGDAQDFAFGVTYSPPAIHVGRQ